MGSNGPSWADQWGSGGIGDNYGGADHHDSGAGGGWEKKNSGNKMANVKAAASAGLGKAKVVAAVGAQKVASGTSVGFKWMKNQCQKKNSK